jgi:hypothetical protein
VSLAAYAAGGRYVIEAGVRWDGETDAIALIAGPAAPGAGLRVLAFEP